MTMTDRLQTHTHLLREARHLDVDLAVSDGEVEPINTCSSYAAATFVNDQIACSESKLEQRVRCQRFRRDC